MIVGVASAEQLGWLEVWWDGEEVGNGSDRGSTLCPTSPRKTFRRETHPPCVQKLVAQLRTVVTLMFDNPVAETSTLF